MHHFLALLAVAYLGHPLNPPSASAAEQLTTKPPSASIELTDEQMDEATAGAAFRFQFNRYGAYARTITSGVGNVTTATNSNGTLQVQGSGSR